MAVEKKINYAELLSNKAVHVTYDKLIFEMWHKKKITTRECFDSWIKNNKPDFDQFDILTYWDEKQFKVWLKSLGY